MPKLLRKGEKITFIQTRGPLEMWRYIKTLANAHSSDGTVTRLCTDHMVEYLQRRPWERLSWQRPQDVENRQGDTGWRQINLPLSNMDSQDRIITSRDYLKEKGILELFDFDKHAAREACELNEFNKLSCIVAKQQDISNATFGFTYLYWLSVHRYRPKSVKELDVTAVPTGKVLTLAPAPAPARARRPRP